MCFFLRGHQFRPQLGVGNLVSMHRPLGTLSLAPRGLSQLRLCFLPTSMFAGPSPLEPNINTLLEDDRKWLYSAYDYRSTFFDLYPAKTETAKGLLVYHTSIMLLSLAEKPVARSHGLVYVVVVAFFITAVMELVAQRRRGSSSLASGT